MLHPLKYNGELPSKFTYPFFYTPHPAAEMAAKEVQAYLEKKEEWREELQKGKMFGVLVVKDHKDSLCFIAAYSGLLDGRNNHEFFVPPIYDALQPNEPFKTNERRISLLSKAGRNTRNYSIYLQRWLFAQYNIMNAREESLYLIDIFNKHYSSRKLRSGFSLTEEYSKNSDNTLLPPSGAGDCCAPKLLQYAFLHKLKPICMAEFWWGDSPKGEIRHHLQYYPACSSKCKPILSHMLQGIEVEENPQAKVLGTLETIYEDDYLLLVNKPAGMLSAPGKGDAVDVVSALTDLYQRNESNSYPLTPIHRLDQATSGLLLLAKKADVFKQMQTTFAKREVRKEYVALLENSITSKTAGSICLPLARDIMNSPYQKVDYEKGKEAITEYSAEDCNSNRILLFPHTGRTHQLRVHCAHKDGLNNPILGDTLYGSKTAQRMYLHFQRLEFIHPVTGEEMEFFKSADFNI